MNTSISFQYTQYEQNPCYDKCWVGDKTQCPISVCHNNAEHIVQYVPGSISLSASQNWGSSVMCSVKWPSDVYIYRCSSSMTAVCPSEGLFDNWLPGSHRERKPAKKGAGWPSISGLLPSKGRGSWSKSCVTLTAGCWSVCGQFWGK